METGQDLFGFHLKAQMLALPDSCEEVEQLGYLMALFYAEEINQSVKEFANDCIKKMGTQRTYAHNGVELPVYLRPGTVAGKTKVKLGEELLEMSARLSSMKKLLALENRAELKGILHRLEQRQDFAAVLLAASVYFELGNEARANRFLRKLLSLQLHTNTFLFVGERPRAHLSSLMESVLIKIEHLARNRTLVKALGMKLAIEGGPALREFMNSEWDIDLGDPEVTNLSKSHIYGRPYVGAWIGHYLEQRSQDFILNALVESDYFQRLSRSNPWEAWVLQFDLNVPKAHQSAIADTVASLLHHPSHYLQDTYFKVMANSRVKNLLEGKGAEFKKPLFTQERNFYKSLLAQSIATEYALFKLLKMGDTDLSYLGHLYGN